MVTLFLRLRSMAPGETLLLTATDPGARHDLPAWCRMTGHHLLDASPPHFLISRKD